MSIIEQIKAEIERRSLCFNKEAEKYQALNSSYSQNCYRARDALRDLENFLDTIKSEKPMNQKGLDVTDFCKPIDPGIAQCIADYSWEMLGEDEKPVPADLEEAAKEYAKTTFKKPYSDNPNEEVTIVEPDKYAGFIAGAKWIKEHLKK